MKPTHMSLFSGIGGIDLASEWAGFETIFQCELADYPYQVLCKHWPDVPKERDIRNVTKQSLESRGITNVSLLSGGFPCQDLSNAGTQTGLIDESGNITRSGLWFEMFRIIREIRPRWILAENVRGAVNKALDTVESGLKNENYQVRSILLPAFMFGAPHERERIFIIAHSNEVDGEKGMGILKNGSLKILEETSRKRSAIWLQTASDIFRMDDGLSKQLDQYRIECLGNAVVPQQVYPILQAIADIENNIPNRYRQSKTLT